MNTGTIRFGLLFLMMIAGLIYVVWQSATVFLLLFLAICLSILIHWAKEAIQKKINVSANTAMGILIIVTGLSLFIACLLLLPVLNEQLGQLSEAVPEYQGKMKERLSHSEVGRFFLYHLYTPEDWLFSMGEGSSGVIDKAFGLFSNMFGVITAIVLVTFIAFHLAYSPKTYLSCLLRMVPVAHRKLVYQILLEINHTLKFWLLGQAVSMLLLGVATFFVLSALGIPFALLLALFTAMMTFIPNFGPIVAAVPILLVTLISEPEKLFLVCVFYLVLQMVEGFIITPKIQEKAIKVPAVLVLLAQLILVNLLGVLGVLSALPLIACGSVLFNRIYVERVLEDDLASPLFGVAASEK